MSTFTFNEASAPWTGVDWNTHIVLKCNDSAAFAVPRDIGKQSQLIETLIKDAHEGSETILDVEVDRVTLKYVLDFCQHHHGNAMQQLAKPLYRDLKEQLDDWQKAYLYTDLVKNGKEEDHILCKKVMEASNYLQIDDLKQLTCACFGNMMREKTTEQLRALFHVINDYTPEEEAALEQQNYWCEDHKDGK